MSQIDIETEVLHERSRQDEKWGEQNHKPIVWAAILGEEQGEICKATLENRTDEYRQELIQLAAVAIAAIECLDRLSAPK